MDLQSSDVVYRINPVTRVIAALVFVGYFIAVIAGYFTTPRPDRFPWGLVIIGAVAVTLAYNYLARWRLFITAQGLTRRRYLLGEDHWPWEDFASGKIEKIYPMKLRDRKRPLWRRTINLQALADCDAPTVMQALNWHYQPAELELPDTLEVKYGLGWVVTFTSQGIHVKERRKVRDYRWSDVERIRVLRLDTVSRDFANLEIFLPGEKIRLYVTIVSDALIPDQVNRSWVGAKAEEINEYLRQQVPAERWKEQVAGDEITDMEDLEAELAERREMAKVAWMMCVGYLLIYALFTAWVASKGPVSENEYVFKGLFIAGATVFVLIPTTYRYYKMRRYVEEAQHESLHV